MKAGCPHRTCPPPCSRSPSHLCSRGSGPGVGSGPPRAEQMSLAVKLDVPSIERARRRVAVRELKPERVASTRFTVVGDLGVIGAAAAGPTCCPVYLP